MKITSKGRVTVPRHIREVLGLLPNTDVEWEMRDGAAVLIKARSADPGSGRALIDQMRGRGTVDISTDEIIALTRGE